MKTTPSALAPPTNNACKNTVVVLQQHPAMDLGGSVNNFSKRVDSRRERQHSKEATTGSKGLAAAAGPSSGVVSPVFDIELDALRSARASLANGLSDGVFGEAGVRAVGSRLELVLDVDKQVAELLWDLSSFERKLLQASEELRTLCCGEAQDSVQVETFAQALLARGYLVQVRDGCSNGTGSSGAPAATKDNRSCLQKLKHRFIVCIGVVNGERNEELYFKEPIIVDPLFKEQFLIAQPTARFQLLLQAVPSTFVGSLSCLDSLVRAICDEMTAAFKLQDLPLPPWRTRSATLSKWSPSHLRQLAKTVADARERVVCPMALDCRPGAGDGELVWYVAQGAAAPGRTSLMDLSELLCTEEAVGMECSPVNVTVVTASSSRSSRQRTPVDRKSSNGHTSLPGSTEHPLLRFSRKASSEFKQKVDGKKVKSLLAAALKKCSAGDLNRHNNRSLYTTEETNWGRINTVRWGAPYKG